MKNLREYHFTIKTNTQRKECLLLLYNVLPLPYSVNLFFNLVIMRLYREFRITQKDAIFAKGIQL